MPITFDTIDDSTAPATAPVDTAPVTPQESTGVVPPASTAKPSGRIKFDLIDQPEAPHVSTYQAIGGDTSYSDYLKALGAGGHQVGAGVTGILGELPDWMMRDPEARAALQSEAKRHTEEAEKTEKSMTPAAQEPGFLKHPLVSTIEAAPQLAAVGGAEAIGGPVAAGAVMAGLTGGETATRYRQEGITPTFGNMALPMAISGVTGALPVGKFAGKIATGPIAGRVLSGGLGTATYGIGGAGTELTTEAPEISAGKRDNFDWSEIGRQGYEQAKMGLLGFAHGAEAPKVKEEKTAENLGADQAEKHAEPKGGESNQTGSDREGRKPEAQKGAIPVTPGVTTGEGFEEIPGTGFAKVTPDPNRATGPAPPADPSSDPNIAAAAKGQGARPSAEEGTPPGPVGAPTPEQAAPAPTKGPAAKKAPEPEKPPGTPPTPEQVKQREEVMDKSHPRDVMHYPAGTEVPPIPANLKHSWGKYDLPDDGGTLVFDRNLKGGSKVDSKQLNKAKETGMLDKYVQDVLGKADERSAAHEAKAAEPAPVTPPESPEVPPPLETPQEPQGAPLAAKEEPPATTLPAEPTPPSAASPEAPRAQPAEVVEAPAPQPTGVDKSRGVAALLAELKTRAPTPEETGWLHELGIQQGKISEAAVSPKVSEIEQAHAAAKKPGEEVPAAEKVTPGVSEKPRVLEAAVEPERAAAIKAEALKAKAAAQAALKKAKVEEKKQARIQKEVETGEAQKAESHKGKEKQKATEENNNKAREVVMRHLPKGDETPQEQHARAHEMMKDAVESGVHIPDKFRGQHSHSDDVILLAEARARIGKGKGDNNAFKRFKDRETAYYKEAGSIGKIRREESGELGAKGSKAAEGEGKEEAIPEAGALETHVEEPEDKIEAEKARLAAEAEDAKLRAEQAAHEAKLGKEAEPKKEELIGPVQEYKPEVAGAAKEAPVVTGEGKLAAFKPKVTGKISLGKAPKGEELKAKAKEAVEEAKAGPEGAKAKEKVAETAAKVEAEKPKSKLTADEKLRADLTKKLEDAGVGGPGEIARTGDRLSRWINVRALRSGTLKDIVSKYFDLNRYSEELREGVQKIHDRMMELGSDVKMHFVTNEDMKRIVGDARGVYVSIQDKAGGLVDHHIFLNAENMAHDTPFHEGIHAVTQIAIKKYPELKERIEALRDAVRDSPELEKLQAQWKANPELMPTYMSHAFSNADEFLTAMMTRPEVQDMLKHIKISRELADKLDIPKWRRATAWEGMLANLRKVFGLGPRETNAIEAAFSLGEQTLLAHREAGGELMAYAGRWQKADAEEAAELSVNRSLDPAARREDDEKLGSRLADTASNTISNLKAKAQEWGPKLMAGPTMDRLYSHLFTDKEGNILGKILEIGRSKAVELDKLRNKDLPIYKRAVINAVKYAGRQDDYAQLKALSSNFNIDASKSPPKTKKNLSSEARKRWQSNENWPEAHRIYNSLPEEMQQQYLSEMKFYRDKQNARAQQHLDVIIDNHPLPAGVTREEVMKQIKEGDMDDKVTEHYYNLKQIGDIRQMRRLMSKNLVYFPSYREGRYVVTGRYEMPSGGHSTDINGKDLADNVRQFDTRDEAHKFASKTGMHASYDTVYYAKDTGKRVFGLEKEKAEARAHNNIVTRDEVTLQREHTEMRSSYSEAKQVRDALEKAGLGELSGVMDKRKEHAWGRLNTGTAEALESRINDSALTKQQKQAAVQAVRDHLLVRRSGMQQHLITKRFVSGADYGSAEALRSYSESANRHTLDVKYHPEMDAAMQRMEAHERANRGDEDAYQRSTVSNELKDRAYRSPDDLASKQSPIMSRLMMISYMHWLIGPRHLMMMQSHPYVYSAPEMAGRHGAAAYGAIHKAAKDLGGDLLGVRKTLGGTWRQLRSIREQARDPELAAKLAEQEDITGHMLSQPGVNAREREDMQKVVDTGEMHSGFGNDFYAAKGMGKADALMQQWTRAQDAQNRAVVGLSAYRLEYERTGSREQALAYARRVIQDTIGVHSSMDMASALQHPVARYFMQFKHFPLRQTGLLLRNVIHAFRNEDPAVRKEAFWAAAHQLTTSFAGAGVHGLPIGVLKMLAIAGSAMGITPTPAQFDDKFRLWLNDKIGSTATNIFEDGLLSAVPHGPNMNNMFSRDTEFGFGQPSGNDLMGYLLKDIGGAPVSTLGDTVSAMKAGLHGDWQTMLEKAPSPRILNDIAKAYKLQNEGLVVGKHQLTPGSAIDTVWKGLGFGTQQAQRLQTGHAAAQEEIKAKQAEPKTVAEQLKAQAKAKREKDILGIPVSKKNQQILKERQAVYQ